MCDTSLKLKRLVVKLCPDEEVDEFRAGTIVAVPATEVDAGSGRYGGGRKTWWWSAPIDVVLPGIIYNYICS